MKTIPRLISILMFFLNLVISSAVLAKDQIDEYIHDYMQSKNIPALQIAILTDNKLQLIKTYGLANLSFDIKANDETLFAINSITKAFVGVAVMQLVEQGKLSLKHYLGNYLDDIPDSWKGVRIEQLLAHQSGLPDVMNSIAQLRSTNGWEESWQQTLEAPLVFKSGEQFQYNQTNYVLIGRIITKLTGLSFQEFISVNQLNVVGMPRTERAGFNHYQAVLKNSATGYSNVFTDDLVHAWEYFPLEIQTAAGMQSTAYEIAQWLIALQTGKLLKLNSLETLFTPIRSNDGNTAGFGGSLNGYGIGWPLSIEEENINVIALGGGRATIAIIPDTKMAIIILTNLQGAFPERIITDVADLAREVRTKK